MVEDKFSTKPLIGVSLNTDPNYIRCLLPYFECGAIDVIEWSFDTLENENQAPNWLADILMAYSNEDRLLGHGVFYSLLDAKWTQKQDHWIQKLEQSVKRFNYRQITEHFGFMSSGDFHKGCPLPVPLNNNTLKIGIDRLIRMQEAAQVPVGIENLAFAFSLTDVYRQGEFLQKLISPVNGFIILDLHNIYCQSHNFNVDFMQLIELYPLELVREIHVSGGSWESETYGDKKIRRDTHDGSIPNKIFDILPSVLKKCPALEFIIFERLEGTFLTEKAILEYQRDFERLRQMIWSSNTSFHAKEWGNATRSTGTPLYDPIFYREQQELCNQLANADDMNDLSVQLENWGSTSWEPEMIETAIKLSKKWK